MSAAPPRVVVVGAGMVGACLAWQLARRGAPVVLVDSGDAAGGVTSRSFGWINVTHGVAEPAAPLRQRAIEAYHALQGELDNALPVSWSGALTWSRDPAETERSALDHAARGFDVRLLRRAEIAALEPCLVDPPECAAFAAAEGALEPSETTRALVHAARGAGADIRLRAGPARLAADDRRVTGVLTGAGAIDADVVVLAAGSGAVALATPLGVALPVHVSRAILLRLRTSRRLAATVMSCPQLEVRQAGDGLMLCAEYYVQASGADGPQAIAQRALAAIRKGFTGAGDVALEAVTVGDRPMPDDGVPIIGHVPGVDGLYVTVMHAGVTLAAITGRLAASEILDEGASGLLEPCRPGRCRTRQTPR